MFTLAIASYNYNHISNQKKVTYAYYVDPPPLWNSLFFDQSLNIVFLVSKCTIIIIIIGLCYTVLTHKISDDFQAKYY